MNCWNQGVVLRARRILGIPNGNRLLEMSLGPGDGDVPRCLCVGQRGVSASYPEWPVQQSGRSSICSSCSCHVAFSAWLSSRCVRFAVTDIE